MSEVFRTGAAELRLGKWQDVLAHVDEVSTLIVDAPYSERTHGGQRHGHKDPRYSPDNCLTGTGLPYASMNSDDVCDFVEHWEPRTRGWFVTITDHTLVPVWSAHLERMGRYVFAPLACVQSGMNVRLAGDGPSNWTCYAVVARTAKLHKWGTLPGAYVFGQDQDRKRGQYVVGGKSLALMRALVRDYTRPGDLVCDPCAGGGTTLLAALMEGRRAVGAECLPEHYEIARKRLDKGVTPPLFVEDRPAMEQADMFASSEEE